MGKIKLGEPKTQKCILMIPKNKAFVLVFIGITLKYVAERC
jgi:hypothetical protein